MSGYYDKPADSGRDEDGVINCATNFQFFPRNPRRRQKTISQPWQTAGRRGWNTIRFGNLPPSLHRQPGVAGRTHIRFARMVGRGCSFAAEMGRTSVLHPGAHGDAIRRHRKGGAPVRQRPCRILGGARVLRGHTAAARPGSTVSDIAGLIQAAGGRMAGTRFDSCHLLAAANVSTPAGTTRCLRLRRGRRTFPGRPYAPERFKDPRIPTRIATSLSGAAYRGIRPDRAAFEPFHTRSSPVS